MSHRLRPTLRLIMGPAVVAAFAGFELRHAGTLAAVTGAWCGFAISVFALERWGKIQFERSRRHLQTRRSGKSSGTR